MNPKIYLSFDVARTMFQNAKKESKFEGDLFVGDLVEQFDDEVYGIPKLGEGFARFESIATALYVLGAMTMILGRSVMDLEQKNKELEAKIDFQKIKDILAEKQR